MTEENNLHEILSNYLHKLESLHETLPSLMMMAQFSRQLANAKKGKFLQENGELIDESDDKKKYSLKIEHQRLAGRLDKKVTKAKTAFDILPGKFLVSFVSEYDAFLGELVKSIFRIKPELLDGSERSISLSDLKQIGSVEAAYEHILEKEVESLLRKSHAEQFEWLEKNLICH